MMLKMPLQVKFSCFPSFIFIYGCFEKKAMCSIESNEQFKQKSPPYYLENVGVLIVVSPRLVLLFPLFITTWHMNAFFIYIQEFYLQVNRKDVGTLVSPELYISKKKTRR